MDDPKVRKKRQANIKKKDKGNEIYNQKTIRIKEGYVSSSKDPK
jgi:hypothetical protein